MSADTVAVVLVILMAPAATLFPLIYGFTSPWYRTLLGRALLTHSVGLALLIDFSLIYHWLGPVDDAVRLGVYSVILAGVWLQLGALLLEKWRARRG